MSVCFVCFLRFNNILLHEYSNGVGSQVLATLVTGGG